MNGAMEGGCIVTTLPGGRLRIDRADPRVLISASLLRDVFITPAPGVSLNTGLVRQGPSGTPFWEGAVLKIEGVNRTVVYRIGGYVPSARAYAAEWPD